MKKRWRDVKAGDRVMLTVIQKFPSEVSGNTLIKLLEPSDLPVYFKTDSEVEVVDEAIAQLCAVDTEDLSIRGDLHGAR